MMDKATILRTIYTEFVYERTGIIANPKAWSSIQRGRAWLFLVPACSYSPPATVLVFGECIEEAIDVLGDALEEHAPGFIYMDPKDIDDEVPDRVVEDPGYYGYMAAGNGWIPSLPLRCVGDASFLGKGFFLALLLELGSVTIEEAAEEF